MSREPKPKPKQDFSDIDHLDRATEVFLRDQRKALGVRHRKRTPRWLVWIRRNSTRLTVAAALVLVCGIALFAGVRFMNRGPDLRQPAESSVTETVSAEPEQQPAEEAQAAPDIPPESEPEPEPGETEPTTAVTTAPERPESAQKTETSAGTLPSSAVTIATRTTETVRSVSTGVDSAGYVSPSSTSAPTLQTTAAAGTTRTTATTRTTSAKTTATTTRTTAGTTSKTTTRTTTTTTRTTTTTTRTTTRTTTTTTKTTTSRTTTTTTRTTTKITTTTTTTTTTAPPQPELVVKNVKLGKCERYGTDQYSQTLSVIVYNNSSVKHTGSTKLRFYIQYAPNITHVGCTSGNANQTQYNAGTVTFSYNTTLTAWSYDTVTIRVIADEPFVSVTF